MAPILSRIFSQAACNFKTFCYRRRSQMPPRNRHRWPPSQAFYQPAGYGFRNSSHPMVHSPPPAGGLLALVVGQKTKRLMNPIQHPRHLSYLLKPWTGFRTRDCLSSTTNASEEHTQVVTKSKVSPVIDSWILRVSVYWCVSCL
ncbi:hypothetical protein RSAG8_05369, partial [Rhizoctonia solani AG-8 WAC10335]